MHIDSEVSPVCCKTPLHRHKFSNWCTVLERFSFYQVLFFSCVRLISFLVVSAKMSGWKICRIKLHRRPRKEIRISAQVWFQAVNGLCLAEFKQWPSGQMGDKFSPIFRSLRLAARHGTSRFPLLSQNISYVFLFLRNFKISFPSVFAVYLVLFSKEKWRKNLTILFQ